MAGELISGDTELAAYGSPPAKSKGAEGEMALFESLLQQFIGIPAAASTAASGTEGAPAGGENLSAVFGGLGTGSLPGPHLLPGFAGRGREEGCPCGAPADALSKLPLGICAPSTEELPSGLNPVASRAAKDCPVRDGPAQNQAYMLETGRPAGEELEAAPHTTTGRGEQPAGAADADGTLRPRAHLTSGFAKPDLAATKALSLRQIEHPSMFQRSVVEKPDPGNSSNIEGLIARPSLSPQEPTGCREAVTGSGLSEVPEKTAGQHAQSPQEAGRLAGSAPLPNALDEAFLNKELPGSRLEAVVRVIREAVITHLKEGTTLLRLEVSPPELGELTIRIHYQKAKGTLAIEIYASSKEIGQIISAGVPYLQEQFSQSNLRLEGFTVLFDQNYSPSGDGSKGSSGTNDDERLLSFQPEICRSENNHEQAEIKKATSVLVDRLV